jgi:hypothetical protein
MGRPLCGSPGDFLLPRLFWLLVCVSFLGGLLHRSRTDHDEMKWQKLEGKARLFSYWMGAAWDRFRIPVVYTCDVRVLNLLAGVRVCSGW